MSANLVKVGIREFREHLPQYLLDSSSPMAITRHGETVGFYIPARHHTADKDITALKQAAIRLEALLSLNKLSEAELFAEFRALREKGESK